MATKGLLIDTTKCMGCRGCQVACKNWNELPAEIEPFKGSYQTHKDLLANTYTIVTFNEYEENGRMKWYFGKRQCMHCLDAPCTKVCPVKALSQTATGAVVRDYDKCIGCQYCVYTCPFSVPKYDKQVDKMNKCHLCYQRTEAGLLPACVTACPPGAIEYGERDSLLAKATKRVNEVKKDYPNAQIYGAKELGGTNVLYVLADKPEQYGFVSDPKVASTIPIWQSYIQPYGGWLIGLAAAGAVTSFFTTRLLKAGKHVNEGGKGHGEQKSS